MELGPKRPSLLWFWGPNSIMVVYMDPLGESSYTLSFKLQVWQHFEFSEDSPSFAELKYIWLSGP